MAKYPIFGPVLVVAIVAFFFCGAGAAVWYMQFDANKKWLQNMGMENFNAEQISMWERCNSIDNTVDELSRKLSEANLGSDLQRSEIANAVVPEACIALRELRQQTYANRVLAQKMRAEQQGK
jgi:hypothetical protein